MGDGLRRAIAATKKTRLRRSGGLPRPTTTEHPETREGLENLGRMVRDMVSNLPAIVTATDERNLGLALTRCMKAGLKATMPGDQTDRQIVALLPAFRANFNRQLVREGQRTRRAAEKRRAEIPTVYTGPQRVDPAEMEDMP